MQPNTNGLHNAAVFLASKKLKFNRGLLAELRWLRDHASEDELERSALRHLFRTETGSGVVTDAPKVSSLYQIAALNTEQRGAVRAACRQSLTLILGPPGTGKTDVGVGVAINQMLEGHSLLLCSRNHAAVREFVSRCNSLPDTPPLVVQPGEEGQPLNVAEAVLLLLKELEPGTRPGDVPAREAGYILSGLERTSAELLRLELELSRHRELHCRAAELNQCIEVSQAQLPRDTIASVEQAHVNIKLARALESLLPDLERLLASSEVSSMWRKFCVAWKTFWLCWQWNQAAQRFANEAGLKPPQPILRGRALCMWLREITRAARHAVANSDLQEVERQLGALPQLETLSATWRENEKQLLEQTSQLLPLYVASRFARLDAEEVRRLRDLQPLLRAREGRGLVEKTRREIQRRLQLAFPTCLKLLPLWAVTNLSLRKRIPLVAGGFDLAVIDEASQCDIASAIPILFRARRAAIIGDRFQLPHTTRLPLERDGLIFAEAGLERVEALIYRYAANSLYDLADYRLNTGGNGQKIMLRDHYRCHEDIINFCSETFYPQPLRVRTDAARLHAPHGRAAGLHWTHLAAFVKPGKDGGCCCEGEAEACMREVAALIRERGFTGSIGIVTPFKAQKMLLRQLLEQTLSSAELARCPVHVDTAHGFQGGQRDVVLMSLVLGPDMPDGSKRFLGEGQNLFNVAVSRASAVLHVIGNLEFAERCGIAHIQKFARYYQARQERQALRSKPPVPDRWEIRLRQLLSDADLHTVSQHPVDGRFLDLAYLNGGLKLDIEVDGMATHLDEAGNRVEDDLWRDHRLRALGWHVMRFWVCQVRDQPEKCVVRVKQFLNTLKDKSHEQR